ncbi:BnaC03g13150D [Brassica napus]|uniref:BnaC03g13150D protein n=1 Tax=Brassica napus TaxID=3708 RepID=A0A078FFZ3_BRANA|nr:BnaC03g13150D [Brassica napus]
MHLLSSNFWENESVASLLRICPVLGDLVVNQTKVFSNNVPASITCRALKTLILRGLTINVIPPSFCMPSLKAMQLLSVKFSGGESVESLLRICPLLEGGSALVSLAIAQKSAPFIGQTKPKTTMTM